MITRVCRGASQTGCQDDDANLRWGDDITDPLLVNEIIAQERGRVEVDKEYTNRKLVDLSVHQLEFTQPGSLVSVVDGSVVHTAMLKNIRISSSMSGTKITAGSALRVERRV